VTEDGIMKVTDFGIAKSANSETITNTSTIMGSAHYLSPEQAKGSFIDCRTDLYSLGVVLYEMVTGTLPFQADTAVTIALKHLQEEVVPPKNLNSKIPDSLNQLILKAMEKEPVRRYQTAKEIIADLQKIKDDPNAKIDTVEDNDDHTIIMSAVTQQISKADSKINKVNDDYDEYDDDEYYDDDEEDEKSGLVSKSKFLKIGVGVILILLLAGLGVAAFKMVSPGGSVSTKEVKVPDLVGKNVDDAKKQLEALNLVLVEADREINDAAEGTIIKMKPDADTTVKEKSEVRVIVSSGSKGNKMPDLEGRDLDEAKTILKSYGIEVSDKDITQGFSDDIPKGQIMGQTPKKDTEVNSKTKVTLVVSKGPEIKKVTVPNVRSFSVDKAKATLTSKGLNSEVIEQETPNESDNGKVLDQSDDDEVIVGKTIKLTVGKYVQKPPVSTTPGTQNTTPGTTDKNSGTTPGTAPNKGTTPGTGTMTDPKTTPGTGNTPTSPFNSTKSN
jgi:serine/threonine-protein kinase